MNTINRQKKKREEKSAAIRHAQERIFSDFLSFGIFTWLQYATSPLDGAKSYKLNL